MRNHISSGAAQVWRHVVRGLRLAFGCAAALAAPLGAAAAAEVAVTVRGVADDRGHVLVAVCPRETFLADTCPYAGATPARPGTVLVLIPNVPPGRYAVQAFHDRNDNRHIDRNFFGIPTEGVGFSNDAPMRFGPPKYEDAEVMIPAQGLQIELRLHY